MGQEYNEKVIRVYTSSILHCPRVGVGSAVVGCCPCNNHPSTFHPCPIQVTYNVKINILGSVIFFWANFQQLATKKSGKLWKFSLLKCKLEPKKMLGFIWIITKLWKPQNWKRKHWRQMNGKSWYCIARPFMHII